MAARTQTTTAVVLKYRYEDLAHNNMRSKELCFRGDLSADDRIAFCNYLKAFRSQRDKDAFIAHQVGLPELFPFANSNDLFFSEDNDHCYHELLSLRAMTVVESDLEERTFAELLEDFRQASEAGWEAFPPYERLKWPDDLFYASHANDVASARRCLLKQTEALREDPYVDQTEDPWTPVMVAAMANADGIARLAVEEFGIDPHLKNRKDRTALSIARDHESHAAVDYLKSLDQEASMLEHDPGLVADKATGPSISP